MSSHPRFALRHLALVMIGGAVGTAARAALLIPDGALWQSLAVPLINVVGALALGMVVGVSVRFASSRRAERFRLLLGAGVMGGFTTYSTFAVQAVVLETIGLTLGTLVLGTFAAWAGLAVGRPRIHRPVDAADRTST